MNTECSRKLEDWIYSMRMVNQSTQERHHEGSGLELNLKFGYVGKRRPKKKACNNICLTIEVH